MSSPLLPKSGPLLPKSSPLLPSSLLKNLTKSSPLLPNSSPLLPKSSPLLPSPLLKKIWLCPVHFYPSRVHFYLSPVHFYPVQFWKIWLSPVHFYLIQVHFYLSPVHFYPVHFWKIWLSPVHFYPVHFWKKLWVKSKLKLNSLNIRSSYFFWPTIFTQTEALKILSTFSRLRFHTGPFLNKPNFFQLLLSSFFGGNFNDCPPPSLLLGK